MTSKQVSTQFTQRYFRSIPCIIRIPILPKAIDLKICPIVIAAKVVLTFLQSPWDYGIILVKMTFTVPDICGLGILNNLFGFAGAGNNRIYGWLMQQPREGQLPQLDTEVCGHLVELL